MKVLHLYISAEHNFYGRHGKTPGECPVEEKTEIECVAGRGIRGDRFFDYKDDYKGQITFFANEVYEDLCARMDVHDKPPWVFRRNIITHGADLNAMVGQEFEIQGIRFFGTEESKPCHWMNTAFGDGAENTLKGRGGLRARILSDGVLRKEE